MLEPKDVEIKKVMEQVLNMKSSAFILEQLEDEEDESGDDIAVLGLN